MWDRNGVVNSDYYLARQARQAEGARCPVCGRGCESLLVARGTDGVLGCEGCVVKYDADLWFFGEERYCG